MLELFWLYMYRTDLGIAILGQSGNQLKLMCSACCNAVHDKRRTYGLCGCQVDIDLEPSCSERSLDAVIR